MRALRTLSIVVLVLAGPLAPHAFGVGTDVLVTPNQPSTSQSEASLARRPADGLLCASWNDPTLGVAFSSSGSGGIDWQTPSAFPSYCHDVCTYDVINEVCSCQMKCSGYRSDSDVRYSIRDQQFYISMLSGFPTPGVVVHATPTCLAGSLTTTRPFFVAGVLPDKPMMAIDNWPSSPHFGRIYVVFRDAGHQKLYLKWSDDAGSTWLPSGLICAPESGFAEPYPAGYSAMAGVHGPWPTVTPSGDLYVAWVRWEGTYGSGLMDIQVSHADVHSPSFPQQATFTMLSSPLTTGMSPHDPASNCSAPTVHDVALVPSPQIEADEAGFLHMVYVHGTVEGGTDHSNVYYSRFDGTSWKSETRLNADSGHADQFMPTLIVNKDGAVVVYWYDTRNEGSGRSTQIYKRVSRNRGLTWNPEVVVSDAAGLLTTDDNDPDCNTLGDYNTADGDQTGDYMIWGDTRAGLHDANVYFDKTA